MTLWEKELFSKMSEEEAAVWRKKKSFEIAKIESPDEVKAEIAKIFKSIEEKKRQEKENQERQKSKNAMGDMLKELEATFSEHKKRDDSSQAAQEMQELECGDLDDPTLWDNINGTTNDGHMNGGDDDKGKETE